MANFSRNGRLYANPWRTSVRHGLSEWSERYASGTRTEEPPDIGIQIYRAMSAYRLLGVVLFCALNICKFRPSQDGEDESLISCLLNYYV